MSDNTIKLEVASTKKYVKMTCIKERMAYQGRLIKWYAKKLGYTEQSNEFYKIAEGKKVPSADRRVMLARMLKTKPHKLWGICPRTAHVVALYVNRQIADQGAGCPMPKVHVGYISVTKKMVKLMDKWESVYPVNKLFETVGASRDTLVLPFVRYNLSGKAKIKSVVWEAAEEEIKRAVEQGKI